MRQPLFPIRLLVWGFLSSLAFSAPAAEAVRLGGDRENPRQPRLAAAPDGTVYAAFGAGAELCCAVSHDGGASFAKAVTVGTLPKLALGRRRGPRVAATAGTVVVTAIGHGDGDLMAWRSTDGGTTWQGPQPVNDVPRAAREGLHDLAAASDGTLAAVWLDLRNDAMQLWMSVSADGGATWGKNQLVYRSPDGHICECCHPTVAAYGAGWLVLWRNFLAGNRDMDTAVVSQNLKTVRRATTLGAEHWPLAACPMDGGDAAAGNDAAWAVWRRGPTCYATDLKGDAKRERRLGDGEQPAVAVTPVGPVFAWLTRRPGDLKLLTPGAAQPAILARQAADPDLIALPDGSVLAAWERVEGDTTAVFVERLAE